jgi:hypothetical protein
VSPIRLTDAQLDQVFRAARPLAVRDRDAFLRMVADALRDYREPGDGQVFRAVLQAQKTFFDPPLAVDGG